MTIKKINFFVKKIIYVLNKKIEKHIKREITMNFMNKFKHHSLSCISHKNFVRNDDSRAVNENRRGTTMSKLEAYYNDLIELYPSFNSYLGRREYDDDYENPLSSTFIKKYKKIMSKYKNVSGNTLDDKILKFVIKGYNESIKIKNIDLLPPLSSFENDVIDFKSVNQNYPLNTSQDFENLVKRYRKFMKFIDSCIKQMKKGAKKRVVLSKLICKRMIDRLEKCYNNKEYIIEEVPEKYGYVFKEYREKLKELIIFLKTKYLKKCMNGDGLCNLPNGKNIYKHLVKIETTTDKTPSEIHQIGLKEVARLKSELEALKVKMGFGSLTLLEFYDKMRNDPTNYYTTIDDVLKGYEDVKATIEKVVMPKYFKTDVTPYNIKALSKDREEGSPGAYYYSGNKTNPGTFYVNMRDVSKIPNGNPKFNMVPLTLHEGNPGHHYQYQYALDKDIPEYKTYAINSNGFVEGWGLYAESLGDALYDQTTAEGRYNYYGRLNYEMFRALRLVVDTGIHYYGWSHKKALNYMLTLSSLEKSELDSEVERYICWKPGQAVSYKIGQMFISDLKTEYMKKPGADIKVFHDKVLENGVLPLKLLGEQFSS
jgi:uncharacterized protein (DUF885 family)